jgi:hypothetical protein
MSTVSGREVGEEIGKNVLFLDLSTEREHGFGQVGVPGRLDGATA